jgi:hypothetical protein
MLRRRSEDQPVSPTQCHRPSFCRALIASKYSCGLSPSSLANVKAASSASVTLGFEELPRFKDPTNFFFSFRFGIKESRLLLSGVTKSGRDQYPPIVPCRVTFCLHLFVALYLLHYRNIKSATVAPNSDRTGFRGLLGLPTNSSGWRDICSRKSF